MQQPQTRSTFSTNLINHHNYDKSKIIQILNMVQQNFGYLPQDEIQSISQYLHVPKSKIWGIITFYSHYKLNPPAKNTVRVCTGTACHVKNSKMLKDTFEKHLQTVQEDIFSTETVACLGCCALSPVFEINGKVFGNLNTSRVKSLAEKIKGDQIE